jgi:hypothetical protein
MIPADGTRHILRIVCSTSRDSIVRRLSREVEQTIRRMWRVPSAGIILQVHSRGLRLLVHRLNAIAPGSIGDKTHIAILLTQIGPEYIMVALHCIDGRSWDSLRRCGRLFSTHRLLGVGQPISESIGDKTHIAILLTQIGPEYIMVVDAIQNDKDPVNRCTSSRTRSTKSRALAHSSPVVSRS